jgi:hypothetical protein
MKFLLIFDVEKLPDIRRYISAPPFIDGFGSEKTENDECEYHERSGN